MEIGCAFGHFCQELQADFDVHGMDVSHYAINVARSRVKIPFRQGNIIEKIPFDESFDVITAIE